MFTISLLDKSPLEAIQTAYDHFAEEGFFQSFSDETKYAIYTAAIRTYCSDHDSVVSNDEIHIFLDSIWNDNNNFDGDAA